ncbi:DUF3806 domain-containing protein [Caulobacter sp. ErkDOM-E]|uniref:DUF3806 domain-containing protein n=1 Tax=Caulobacter sp. ErkDOM-E TaxID=3402778 RepID=UPI003AF47EFA
MEVRALNESETQALQEGFAFAAQYIGQEHPFSDAQAQELYDAILGAEPDVGNFQIATGLVFGEMIITNEPFEWVRIIDEYGEETGLCHKDVTVVCHPISMIQKRLSRREQVDMKQLRDATLGTLEEMISSGSYLPRWAASCGEAVPLSNPKAGK